MVTPTLPFAVPLTPALVLLSGRHQHELHHVETSQYHVCQLDRPLSSPCLVRKKGGKFVCKRQAPWPVSDDTDRTRVGRKLLVTARHSNCATSSLDKCETVAAFLRTDNGCTKRPRIEFVGIPRDVQNGTIVEKIATAWGFQWPCSYTFLHLLVPPRSPCLPLHPPQ
jgi:hypothetical protein